MSEWITVTSEFTKIVDDDEDNPMNWIEVRMPAKYEVCPTCHGKGSSSAYLGAFTQSDMDEMDQDWFDDYLAGHFDRPCEECKGLRVVLVPDMEMIETNQLYKKAYDLWLENERSEAEDEYMLRQEMRYVYGEG
jgi:DnaJ-class molecular chaperone